MKSLDRPERGWGEMVAPHAHHYFHQPDHIAVQYPPGTGAALALYPEGRAVHGMCRTVIGLCVGAGILTLIVSAVTRAWAGAGGGVFALDLALKILGDLGGLSFSIHVVLAPLLGGFILLFLSLILRSAAGCFRISAALAFLAGIALGFAILVRLPVLFLLPGISLLLFGTTRRTCINTGLIAFCLGFAFGGVFPLLWHQHEVAGAWYLATYGSDDNSSPSLAVLEQNFLFYLWGGPGSQYNWALWVSFIGFVGLTITTHRSSCTSRAGCARSWQPP